MSLPILSTPPKTSRLTFFLAIASTLSSFQCAWSYQTLVHALLTALPSTTSASQPAQPSSPIIPLSSTLISLQHSIRNTYHSMDLLRF
ncbi:hypothetical protein E2C01_073548 [Portunus trituberculatus]|uniref:Uncharacterized protein n=1 Tax=Portunus trituberculatus TaxID=210409 RepID=A0A5B7IBZ0_PORTR|nr:hypothetical protein [Portunus trituberculatus]